MGIYLNPGNDLFRQAVNSKIYVDKTMLIEATNNLLDTSDKHICINRPRRFGKSMAANMLLAYYSRDCDSRDLFSKLNISKSDSFEKHLNKYNVFRFDIRGFASKSDNIKLMIDKLEKSIIRDLKREYAELDLPDDYTSDEMLLEIYQTTGIPFVFIIDEWDCIFRIYRNDSEGQQLYLKYLRTLLKEQPYVALDYATGILPVKNTASIPLSICIRNILWLIRQCLRSTQDLLPMMLPIFAKNLICLLKKWHSGTMDIKWAAMIFTILNLL